MWEGSLSLIYIRISLPDNISFNKRFGIERAEYFLSNFEIMIVIEWFLQLMVISVPVLRSNSYPRWTVNFQNFNFHYQMNILNNLKNEKS